MDKRVKISNEQKQEMYKLYENGKSSVEIGEMFGMRASNVVGYLKRGGIPVRKNSDNSRRYTCNNDYFESINTRDKAYWLGFMYADGYLSGTKNVGISLSSIDVSHLEKFRESVNATYPINEYSVSSGFKVGALYSRILINSEKMHNDLISLGCVRNKTDILTRPNIEKHYHADFIRGYLDGDGCITNRKVSQNSGLKETTLDYKVSIVGTDDLLLFIKEFIEGNNIAKITKLRKRKDDQIASNLEFGGNKQVIKFLDLIYNDTNLYLTRKYEKYIELCNYYGRALQ